MFTISEQVIELSLIKNIELLSKTLLHYVTPKSVTQELG